MPFCKGCGHAHVLKKLNEALVGLQLNPSDVCLVTDIGCIGLADALFETLHTVHTTHGRSTAFATGIAMADAILASGKLKTVVLIGDGGAMIGLLHLVHGALLNVDLTVLVCNNFLFGMTGGQNSALSPLGFRTPTTPTGSIVPPLDLCSLTSTSHGEFIARKLATDADLSTTIANAIAHSGFSLVEIVELCTEYGTARNELTGNSLKTILASHGHDLGVMTSTATRKPFDEAYKLHAPGHPTPLQEPDGIQVRFQSSLGSQRGIIIAGSAGERVQSAARQLCVAAAMSGLRCTQKSDNPVTQGSGFSLSEVIISPDEILYTGIESPSAVIVVSEQGLGELQAQGVFSRVTAETMVIADAGVAVPEGPFNLVTHPFRKEHGGKGAAMAAIELYVQLTSPFPTEALGAKRVLQTQR
jgi:pyruvate/2-oxoacid:ferredoxin oxidoreductase beta subunit